MREIEASGVARCVVVCGRNEELQQRLVEQGVAHVFGWVEDMPALMHAVDVVVQNAGGITVHEARACGLPVVTYRTLPGHGETNARALNEAGTVPWIRKPADLRSGLERVIAKCEASADEIPDFAADPVTVILGVAAPAREPMEAYVPGQRDRRRRRRLSRLGAGQPGSAQDVQDTAARARKAA